MSNIFPNNTAEENSSDNTSIKNSNSSDTKYEVKKAENIFKGNYSNDVKYAEFPDWDILPPTQFINPRISK